jgi:hypothetical protein
MCFAGPGLEADKWFYLFGVNIMKKRILAVFAILAVFGLTIAAYAYTQTSTATIAASASCCKDSCPMKNKDGNHAEHGKDHAKGEGHSCCCSGGSCPMKGEHCKGGDHAKMEGHNCCGDSCPMKRKDGQAAAASGSEEGKGCCDNCDCCKGRAKKETAAV